MRDYYCNAEYMEDKIETLKKRTQNSRNKLKCLSGSCLMKSFVRLLMALIQRASNDI